MMSDGCSPAIMLRFTNDKLILSVLTAQLLSLSTFVTSKFFITAPNIIVTLSMVKYSGTRCGILPLFQTSVTLLLAVVLTVAVH